MVFFHTRLRLSVMVLRKVRSVDPTRPLWGTAIMEKAQRPNSRCHSAAKGSALEA